MPKVKDLNCDWAFVNIGPEGVIGKRYIATENGEIYSSHVSTLSKGDIYIADAPLKGHPDKKGYLKVKLYGADGKKYTRRIHRLVLEAFTRKHTAHFFNDVPTTLYQVDHINQNPSDNRLENLRWVTNTINASNRKHSYHSWKKSVKDRLCELYFEERRGFSDIALLTHMSYKSVRDFIRGVVHVGYAKTWCEEHGYEYEIRSFSLPIKWENGRIRRPRNTT